MTEQKFRPKFTNSTVEKDVLTFFSLFEKYAAEVPLEKPWEAPRAHEWDYQTVKQFIVENCKTKYGKLLFTESQAHFSDTVFVYVL